MVAGLTDSVCSKHSEAPGTRDWSAFQSKFLRIRSIDWLHFCRCPALSPSDWLQLGRRGGGKPRSKRVVLRHFRLLWAAAAAFSECGGERAEGAEGLEAGWAEKGGIPSRRRQPGRFHLLRHCREGSEKGHRLLLQEGGRSPAQVRRPCQRELWWRAWARSRGDG